jgi:hypothetical protein
MFFLYIVLPLIWLLGDCMWLLIHKLCMPTVASSLLNLMHKAIEFQLCFVVRQFRTVYFVKGTYN